MRPFFSLFFLKNMTPDNECGNTGYSYGAYQFNSRAIENNVTEVGYNTDFISAVSNKKIEKDCFDRCRVKEEMMPEIVYENCSFVAAYI